jgi:FMN-dependent NADH-azoreductase
MCKAKALYYVTTAGGYIGQNNFGFSYIKALARNFFEIPEVNCYTAEGLDVLGADVEMIMCQAKLKIGEAFGSHRIF